MILRRRNDHGKVRRFDPAEAAAGRELEGKENRKAQFRTAISLILDGKEYLFLEIKNGDYMNASDPSSEIHYMIYERFTEE